MRIRAVPLFKWLSVITLSLYSSFSVSADLSILFNITLDHRSTAALSGSNATWVTDSSFSTPIEVQMRLDLTAATVGGSTGTGTDGSSRPYISQNWNVVGEAISNSNPALVTELQSYFQLSGNLAHRAYAQGYEHYREQYGTTPDYGSSYASATEDWYRGSTTLANGTQTREADYARLSVNGWLDRAGEWSSLADPQLFTSVEEVAAMYVALGDAGRLTASVYGQAYTYAYTDADGDGSYERFDGYSRYDGVSYSGSATASVVPIPAAAWLFGSGLIGLIGITRRKKAA